MSYPIQDVRRRPGPPPLPEPSSILVYTGLDLIGDGLMKLPFLRALRNAYPHAHVTWLAGIGKTVFAGPLAPLTRDLIDEVIGDAGIGRHWTELRRRPLAPRGFDLVLDTQRQFKTTLILKRLRHGAFISGTVNYLLSDRRPSNWTGKKPRMVDNMLDLITAARGVRPTLDRHIMLEAKYERAASEVLPGQGPYAGLAPGAGGSHKRWPLERYIGLARELEQRGFIPVFLLGPDEAGWRGALLAAVPGARLPLQERQIDAGLAASPIFTIAVARRLAIAVANDSGTGHMLAAADTPLVSLFGPTSPAKFAPCVSRGAVIRAQDFGGTAMTAIPLQYVMATLRALTQAD